MRFIGKIDYSGNANTFGNVIKVLPSDFMANEDPGATKNGCIEKLIALDVVLRIGKILEAYPDFDIKYTRSTDVFIPLKDRAKIANDFDKIFLPLRFGVLALFHERKLSIFDP